MKRLALLLPLLALAAVPARAEDPATNAAPSFSRRVPLDGFGSAEIAPGWRISYGPDEATLDGIPKWSVCVYETAAPLDNRLLPERWHGLQPCEIAPALVPTNEVRVLPVRGKPWLLRLSLEGIGVADGKNVRGEVAMSFHRPATDAPAASEPHAENAESAETDPHAAAVSRAEHGPDAEKWKRIVLPIVDFRQSSVVDVVAELEDLARNHDDFVAAALGQGVTFVLDVPADAVDSLPLVTCKMKSVSVYSAIDTIAEMSGLEWSVDGDVIRLTLAQRRPAANETHAEAEDGVDGGCFGHAPSAEN